MGKRKRRHAHDVDLEDGFANLDSIKYRCDVGLKSLLRSVSDFYQSQMQTYMNKRIQTDSSFSDHNLKMKIDLFVRDQLYTHNQNDESLCISIS